MDRTIYYYVQLPCFKTSKRIQTYIHSSDASTSGSGSGERAGKDDKRQKPLYVGIEGNLLVGNSANHVNIIKQY